MWGWGWRSKSRTPLKIVFSVFFFKTMLRNYSFLDHRYSIRFALFLMTLDSRVQAQGGARGQNVECHMLLVFLLLLLKNDILFPSRTEDLTLNVRDQVLD